jgi:hypothetical protein
MGRTNFGEDDGCAYIDHDGIQRKTAKAALYSIGGEEIWLPLSQIKDSNDEIVVIPKWLAEKNDLDSDW